MLSWVQDIQRSCSLFSYLKIFDLFVNLYKFVISLKKYATDFRALKPNLVRISTQ